MHIVKMFIVRSGVLNNKGRFLEACILTSLQEEETYGYSLLDNLIECELLHESTNISIIYRALRSMEKSGLVKSKWVESDQGPRKRLYEITSKGKEELDSLIQILKHRRRCIDQVINNYEKYNK